jgi:hypothetical protein
MPTQKQKIAALNAVPFWFNYFLNKGINPEIIPIIISKIALETNYFTSNAYLLNNNPGGMTWNRNYLKRPGTSIGIKRPRNEGGNYVKYDTLQAAGDDYMRIISRKGRAGSPIDAKTIPDFVSRLKRNGYFTSDPQQYLANIQSIIKRIDSWVNFDDLEKKKLI